MRTNVILILAIVVLVLCSSSLLTAAKKTCVFLHGAGEHLSLPATSDFPEYWGKLHQSLQQCAQVIFNHEDTVQNSWFDETLNQAYCRLAVTASTMNNIPTTSTTADDEQSELELIEQQQEQWIQNDESKQSQYDEQSTVVPSYQQVMNSLFTHVPELRDSLVELMSIAHQEQEQEQSQLIEMNTNNDDELEQTKPTKQPTVKTHLKTLHVQWSQMSHPQLLAHARKTYHIDLNQVLKYFMNSPQTSSAATSAESPSDSSSSSSGLPSKLSIRHPIRIHIRVSSLSPQERARLLQRVIRIIKQRFNQKQQAIVSKARRPSSQEESDADNSDEQDIELQAQQASTTVLIRDTIVFTHSAGNLILAAGIAKGYCDFDASSSWYEVGGPMRGSPVASKLKNVCTKPDVADMWLVPVLSKLHYCKAMIPEEDNINAMYDSLRPDHPMFEELRPDLVLKKRIKGAQCSTSPVGLPSGLSAPLSMIAELADLPAENDGLVPFSSCSVIDSSHWGNSPDHAFYKSEVNHADQTCRNGDNDRNVAQQPCRWFQSRQ